jgi:hypothetical protein
LKHRKNSFEVVLVITYQVFRMLKRIVGLISFQLNCRKHTRNIFHILVVLGVSIYDAVFDNHVELVLLQSKLLCYNLSQIPQSLIVTHVDSLLRLVVKVH